MSEIHPQSTPEFSAQIDEVFYGVPADLENAEAWVNEARAHISAVEEKPDGTYELAGLPINADTVQNLNDLAEQGIKHWILSEEGERSGMELSLATTMKDLGPDMWALVQSDTPEGSDPQHTFEHLKEEAQARLNLHYEIEGTYGPGA